jgi:2-haloacid dehalogenase
MVAAHQSDLAGARACGLQTAYIQRPLEFGPTRSKDVSDNGLNTYHVANLVELANTLGA